MTRGEALDRLAAVCGIENDYIDDGGTRHVIVERTRDKLLAAMGLPLDGDLGALATALESRAWRTPLPPVAVVRTGVAPAVELSLSARRRRGTWRCSVLHEDGSVCQTAFQPGQIEPLAQRRVDGVDLVRLALPLAAENVPGYHQLVVEPADEGDGREASMRLIVTPGVCHLPEALGGEARHWGLAVQLYSLRSRRNWGIGDFGDLRTLAGTSRDVGADFIGVGPLHAAYPADPARCCPYSSSSRLFVNVLYIDVEAVAEVRDSPAARGRLAEPAFQARLRRLRAENGVDYPEVAAVKLDVLRLAFSYFQDHHLAGDTGRGQAYRRFRNEGGDDLSRFALFEALDAHFGTGEQSVPGWPAWPTEFQSPGAPAVQSFAAEHGGEIEFAIYLQWLADQQLGTAARQARRQGLGIGIYRDMALGADPAGAETWAQASLYARGAHLGSPPDELRPRGQDWGLPPPMPQGLRESAYAPFVAALRANMRHAGALRIDHVMSLARLFWVPAGEDPAAGAYVRYPLDDLLGILALESVRHQCLVIGEDFGPLPPDLGASLAAAGVLSSRLLYSERDAGGAFTPPAAYPRQALAAVSSHDQPTLAGFWQGRDIDERARLGLFNSAAQLEAAVVARAQDRARLLLALQHDQLLPEGVSIHEVAVPAVTGELAAAVHTHLARAPAMLLAVQAEDIFGIVDQAYLPGSGTARANWRQRLPVELEAWGGDDRFRAVAETLGLERARTEKPEVTAEGRTAAAVIPDATYRLQLNRDFTLAEATRLLPYLAELGISHCYCSPYLKARPGSRHGYDIVDHNAFNPEIGGADDFQAFSEALGQHGLGQILDIVPNHMGVMGSENGWWLDVLENGRASAFADYFDIDWQPLNPELAGKVLLPLLGDHYGAVLGRGELRLHFDAEGGEFSLFYYQHRLPVDPAEYPRIVGHGFENLAAILAGDLPLLEELQSLLTAFAHLPPRHEATPDKVAERNRDKTLLKRHLAALCARSADIAGHVATNIAEINGRPGDPDSFNALHDLIKAQAWRLAYWRVASDDINYRRFFDINDLAALRVEKPEVFDATHRLVSSLLQDGLLQGLRVDHPDGLYDPAGYFRRLQGQGHGAEARQAGKHLPAYLIIEKVLADHERLPGDWPIHGSTGYRFANVVNGLFVDASTESRMTRVYSQFVGRHQDFDEIVYEAKKLIIRWSLSGELNVLANQLRRIAAGSRHSCDFTLNSLRRALAEIVACFPVYRTYLTAGHLSADDRRHIDWAVAVARRHSQAADVSVFDFVGSVLTGDVAENKEGSFNDEIWRFAMKFQQYSAPVMAKGLEDTAFYRYHRLVSLNDVGGDPRRFGTSLAAFHAANRTVAERWPHTLLAGSTHDGKRSADVRARINVLSEIPAAWKLSVRRWARINRSKKRLVAGQPAPSANDEYLLYQTLFGTWPLGEADAVADSDYAERIERYMQKAVREAKEHSSWINVNVDYEEALGSYISAILAPGDKNLFLADFVPNARRLARFGLHNALAQTLLRLTSPGVPDIYQGDELWQFQLVDPDNRQSVDYDLRRNILAEIRGLRSSPADEWCARLRPLVEEPEDGRIKLYLIWCVLQRRRLWPDVFRDGDYLPLATAGAYADHVCAYARRLGERIAVAVVPRFLARLQVERSASASPSMLWADTRVELPAEWRGRGWMNVFTGVTLTPSGAPPFMDLAALLPDFPVALLVSDRGKESEPTAASR